MPWETPRDTRPKGKPISYSLEEMKRLKRMWPSESTASLETAFPGRSMIGLRQKAMQMGLVGEVERSRRGDIRPLLNGSPEAFYWLGFILADGHITRAGQLVVGVIDEEESHLDGLARYIRTEARRPYANPEKEYALSSFMTDESLRRKRRVAVQDPATAQGIRDLLGLEDSNKTYTPPKVEAMTAIGRPGLDFLFMGFFDGDGSTGTTKFGGRMENHVSWRPVYRLFEENGFLTHFPDRPNAFGYVPKTRMLEFARLSMEHGLPVMRRKWDRWQALAQALALSVDKLAGQDYEHSNQEQEHDDYAVRQPSP